VECDPVLTKMTRSCEVHNIVDEENSSMFVPEEILGSNERDAEIVVSCWSIQRVLCCVDLNYDNESNQRSKNRKAMMSLRARGIRHITSCDDQIVRGTFSYACFHRACHRRSLGFRMNPL